MKCGKEHGDDYGYKRKTMDNYYSCFYTLNYDLRKFNVNSYFTYDGGETRNYKASIESHHHSLFGCSNFFNSASGIFIRQIRAEKNYCTSINYYWNRWA